MKQKIKAIDFFCGAGGLTRGLLDAGIEVLAGVDNDSRLQQTYETNNAPSIFVNTDINAIDIKSLRQKLGIRSDDLVLYAACTPCQPFSTLNRMAIKDERKNLLLSFAALLEEAPPDFIFVENVPGLKYSYGREVYQEFVSIIRKNGFHESNTYSDKLDAQFYGVPQARKRFILLSSRHGKVQIPEKDEKESTIGNFVKKYTSIKDGEQSHEFLNHVCRALSEKHKMIVKAIPKDGGSRKDIKDTSILLKCHQDKPNVHRDVFGRMSWDKPAPTLTCRCTEVYCGRFVHPEQDRGISLREAAAIQTFPDNYQFFGTYQHIARQIGNAVPVRLAERLGVAIVKSII